MCVKNIYLLLLSNVKIIMEFMFLREIVRLCVTEVYIDKDLSCYGIFWIALVFNI